MRSLDELGRMMPPEKARKTLTNEFVRGMISNIGADLLVKHTWDYLQAVARGEKEEQSTPSSSGEVTPEPETIEEQEKSKKKKSTRKVEK